MTDRSADPLHKLGLMPGHGRPLMAQNYSNSHVHYGIARASKGGGGDVPAVKSSEGTSPPDSRVKWPKSSVFSDF